MSCLMTGREADVNRQSHTAVSLAQQGAASALVLSPCLLSTMTKKEEINLDCNSLPEIS